MNCKCREGGEGEYYTKKGGVKKLHMAGSKRGRSGSATVSAQIHCEFWAN